MSRASSPRIPREEFDHHKLIYQNSKAEDSSQFKDTSLLIYGVREMEWRISKQGWSGDINKLSLKVAQLWAETVRDEINEIEKRMF